MYIDRKNRKQFPLVIKKNNFNRAELIHGVLTESEAIFGFVGIHRGFKMQQQNVYPPHVRSIDLTDPYRYDLLDVRKSNSSATRG